MITIASLLFAALATVQTAAPQRTAFVVPLGRDASAQDLALLAALPAAARANGGEPLLCGLGEHGEIAPELADFLRRARVQRLVEVGGSAPVSAGIELERIEAADAPAAARALARRFFGKCTRAVVSRADDYASALCAAVLAARVGAPLVYAAANGLAKDDVQLLAELGASNVLFVGADANFALGAGSRARLERLANAAEVARWMQRHALAVDYLAVANPNDRTAGVVRKTSLAAAVLAAGRGGALVPVELEIDACGASAAETLAAVQRPRIDALQRALAAQRNALGAAPRFLCLVGWPDALPMPRVPSKDGIDIDPVSDLEYANLDADPFVESASGRFIAEDAAATLLLAARSLDYEQLLDPSWSSRFALAEWECAYADLFANAGFEAVPRLELGSRLEADSPATRVAALVHASHASWIDLGSTCDAGSSVLLAPCVVESAGCSTAALDQDPAHRSVAARLLRNGAVAFVGNVRRTIGQYELYRSEFWSCALAGLSLGEAHRRALNHVLVAALDKHELETGSYGYELHNVAFYGDPALVLHRPAPPRVRAARAERAGAELVVHAPAQWWPCRIVPPADWKRDPEAPITTFRGCGVAAENSWDGAHQRNLEAASYLVEYRTRQRLAKLDALAPPPGPLGLLGGFWIDEHADGTRSLFFRVGLVEFDMDAGRVLRSVERLRFRAE